MEMTANQGGKTVEERRPDHQGNGDSMMAMMVMMMTMCFGVVLLFAVIPAIGWPLGIVVGVAAGGVMLFLHRRYMRHGRTDDAFASTASHG